MHTDDCVVYCRNRIINLKKLLEAFEELEDECTDDEEKMEKIEYINNLYTMTINSGMKKRSSSLYEIYGHVRDIWYEFQYSHHDEEEEKNK